MNYNKKIAGQVIGKLRLQRDMSQEVLSGLAGMSRSHLAMIETGSKNPNVNTLWKIASALGLRLSELIALIEEEHLRTLR